MTTSDLIARATAHGAKFKQEGSEWQAIAMKRGRAIPLVILAAPTQEEAAAMYLHYFRIKH